VKLHAAQYQSDGVTYGITIDGSTQEVMMHCWRLGLEYLGEVVEQIPFDGEALGQ